MSAPPRENVADESDSPNNDEDMESYLSSTEDDTSLTDHSTEGSESDRQVLHPLPIMPQAKKNERVLLVVTGASRGFGKAIAKAFVQSCQVQTAILVARSGDGLNDAGHYLKEISPSTQLVHHAMDLQRLDELDGLLNMVFLHMFAPQRFCRLVWINNAGTVGPLGPVVDTPSLEEMRAAVDLNITSSLWLTVRFARFLAQNPGHPPATCVNISSLVAIEPFPTMALYSAGKAARDMYHACVAKECPNLKTLNYAPGPLETDMTEEIRACETLDPMLKPNYQNTLIDPMDSAQKLVSLVLGDQFESGAHIDYYDV